MQGIRQVELYIGDAARLVAVIPEVGLEFEGLANEFF